MSTNPPVGRWFVGSGIRHSDTAGICVLHEDGDEITEETIAEVLPSSDGNKTRDKQAALLAAAPDMLAAIGEAVDMLEGNPSRAAIQTVRAMLAGAIARTKGA